MPTAVESPLSATSPPPPPHPLAQHLLNSLLAGTCADVNLVVRQWNVSYRLHRVVLVQAGFFHSLFCGGFSEQGAFQIESSSSGGGRQGSRRSLTAGRSNGSLRVKQKSTLQGKDLGVTDVELAFDDPNISRTAFE